MSIEQGTLDGNDLISIFDLTLEDLIISAVPEIGDGFIPRTIVDLLLREAIQILNITITS